LAAATPSKIRVAIVGGGCGGLSAAWQLSKQPGYDIHVYEKSWRLGGKGASVRDADGRILEHGLHVWFGFYENSFKMMRECYAEVERRNWGPGPDNSQKLTHGRIDDAFFPEPNVGVAGGSFQGEWAFWSGLFPPTDGLPGTPLDERTDPFSVANYLLRCFGLLKALMLSVIGPVKDGESCNPSRDWRYGATVDPESKVDGDPSIAVLIERMTDLLRASSLTGATLLLQAVTILEAWLRSLNPAPRTADPSVRLMEALAAQTRRLLRDLTKVDAKFQMRADIIDIVMTSGVGLLRDCILFDDRGLDAINDYDFRDWLRKHGATDTAIESRFLVGAYDLLFAYEGGERSRPALAAGVALRGALRMFFTYRGSVFWRMGSGMGDAVFAPLYKVLLTGRRLADADLRSVSSARDEANSEDGSPIFASTVQFHFLHEASKVGYEVSRNQRRYVTSLEFSTRGDEQELDERSKDALDARGCWPENPDSRFADAIKKGSSRRELKLGLDFDRVIFAMGIDDFRKVGADRLPDSQRADSKSPGVWKGMGDSVTTVATKSAQVWLRKDLAGLGWDRGSGLIAGLGFSFGAWADMTLTLAAERAWRGPIESPLDEALSVEYFCDALSDGEIDKITKEAQSEAVRNIKSKLLNIGGGLESTAAAPELREGDARADALDAIVKIRIPNELHGAIDVVLSRLLRGIAMLGPNVTSKQLAQILTTAGETFEADVFTAAVARLVESDLDELLEQEMCPAWPMAFENGRNATDWEISRHSQANFEGSDRYTQSLPSSIGRRISPLDRSVENMTIAGDWTACGLDTGCVEAAVISGMLACYAISGKPNPRSITGYDHP
jgi:uncharacterized protein with NAD-binding domain and iron-sulfur cluster